MFLVVVFKSYATATELPTIPEELLILMGISSFASSTQKRSLKVYGLHIGTGSTWSVSGDCELAAGESVTRDPENPTLWHLHLSAPPEKKEGFSGEVSVTTATGRTATAKWSG